MFLFKPDFTIQKLTPDFSTFALPRLARIRLCISFCFTPANLELGEVFHVIFYFKDYFTHSTKVRFNETRFVTEYDEYVI